MKKKPNSSLGLSIKCSTVLSGVVLVTVACSAADAVDAEKQRSHAAELTGAPHAASAPVQGLAGASNQSVPGGGGGTIEVCMVGKQLYFEGRCRPASYFERFVTPGATYVMAEGTRGRDDEQEAIAILEMPNARTTRVKIVAASPEGRIRMAGRRFVDGHELLGQVTTTQLANEGFSDLITTVDAVEGGHFKTVWYERVARSRTGHSYRWSTDQCSDVNGNPLPYESGEACGPLQTIPKLGDGPIADECKSAGKVIGGIAQVGCVVAATYVGAQMAVSGTALVLASSGTAAPAVATIGGAVLGAVVGGQACGGAQKAAEGVGELVCDAVTGPADAEPPRVAIEFEEPSSGIAEDPCAELGGTAYTGETGVLHSGGCSDVEDTGDGVSQITLGEDDAAYEVTVYGDSGDCAPQIVSANDNMCVVVTY